MPRITGVQLDLMKSIVLKGLDGQYIWQIWLRAGKSPMAMNLVQFCLRKHFLSLFRWQELIFIIRLLTPCETSVLLRAALELLIKDLYISRREFVIGV